VFPVDVDLLIYVSKMLSDSEEYWCSCYNLLSKFFVLLDYKTVCICLFCYSVLTWVIVSIYNVNLFFFMCCCVILNKILWNENRN